MRHSVDKWLLALTSALIIAGFFIFISASLGLLARGGASFSAVVFKQIFFGLVLGGGLLVLGVRVKYTAWKKYSMWLFFGGIAITALVFVPHIGFAHGGARRWLNLGPPSLQPAQFLKLGYILSLASWFSASQNRVDEYAYGRFPFAAITGLVAVLFLL